MSKEEAYILSGPSSVDFDTGIGLVPQMFQNLQKATTDIYHVNIDTGETISYAQLWHSTIRVASALQELGCKVNSVVTIIGDSDLKVYSVYYGAIFSGAAVGCINPTLQSNEMKQLVTTLKPVVLYICKEKFDDVKSLVESLEEKPSVVITPGGCGQYLDYDSLLTYNPDNFTLPNIPSWDDHVIAILFSSGTTGVPKGAQAKCKSIQYIQRIAVPEHLKRRMTVFPICTDSSIIFITSVLKDMGTFFNGGLNNSAVIKALRQYKPNYWFNSPSNLLRLVQETDLSVEDLSSIELMFCSGAGFTKDQIIFLNKRLFNNRTSVVNSYNSIETLAITMWPGDVDIVTSPKLGSVGKVNPLLHLKVVCRETGKPLGPGLEGELFVKTPFIMLGYLNCPKETAEALDAEGWYRTGDIGYYDEDGYVYITGRSKEVFKHKNRQVSPLQLEAIIQEHPAVYDSAVVGRPDPVDGFLPTAFVTLKLNAPPVTAGDIATFVNDQVADYRKLYGGVYIIDKIPVSKAGKKMRTLLLKNLQ